MGTGKKMAMLKADMAQDIKLREIREHQYEVKIRDLRDEVFLHKWRERRLAGLAFVLLLTVAWLLLAR